MTVSPSVSTCRRNSQALALNTVFDTRFSMSASGRCAVPSRPGSSRAPHGARDLTESPGVSVSGRATRLTTVEFHGTTRRIEHNGGSGLGADTDRCTDRQLGLLLVDLQRYGLRNTVDACMEDRDVAEVLEQFDLRRKTLARRGDAQVFRAHAQRDLAGQCAVRTTRHHEAARTAIEADDALDIVLRHQRGRQHVHLRRAQEAADEAIRRTIVELERCADLLD